MNGTVPRNEYHGVRVLTKNAIPNPRSGSGTSVYTGTPRKEATLGYQAPTMTNDNPESNYRSPKDGSDKPERWPSQLKLTKNSVWYGRRVKPSPADKARGSRNQNCGVWAMFANSPRPAVRPYDYTTRDTAWSCQEVDKKAGPFTSTRVKVRELPEPELRIGSRDREPCVLNTHDCGHRSRRIQKYTANL